MDRSEKQKQDLKELLVAKNKIADPKAKTTQLAAQKNQMQLKLMQARSEL